MNKQWQCNQVWRAMVVAACVPMFGTMMPVAEAQWTQWGGPDQNFTVPAEKLATVWPSEGPKKLWSRELGEGYSAVLVDGGKLYTMSRKDDKQESVVCLDRDTGVTVWEHAYESSPPEGHVDDFGRGPRATPLIVGDRIYTIGVAGVLHCLDKNSGSVHWSHDLLKKYEGTFLNHGYSSSPIEYKGNIITLVGGKDGHGIVAFDAVTGKEAWHNVELGNSYSTPRILKIHGEPQLVTFMADHVVGCNPDNGKLLWKFHHVNQWMQNVCMPQVTDDGMLFISSPEAGARGLKIVKEGEGWKVEEAWSTRKIQFYHVSSIREGHYVYGSTGTMGPAFMACVDIRTGDIAWRARDLAKANIVKVGDQYIALDEDGTLALIRCTPEKFELMTQASLLSKPSWTAPTPVGNRLYLRDKKTIMALDLGA